MKKKILSAILILSMLLTPVVFVSCDDQEDSNPPVTTPSDDSSGTKPAPKKLTAEDLEKQLSDAIDQVAELKNIDFKYVISAEYLIDGSTIKMPITLIMKASDNNGNEPIMYMEMSMSAMGESYEMIKYHENGWDYTVQNGESYKMEAPYTEDDSEEEDESSLGMFMTDLSDKDVLDMKKLTYKNNPDGSRTVSTAVDGEKFQEVFAEAMEMLDGFAALGENTDVSIESSELEYTIKDGYVISYKMKYTMNMTVNGTEATCNMEATAELYNPGKPVTITPPEGYQSFPLYNPSGILPV